MKKTPYFLLLIVLFISTFRSNAENVDINTDMLDATALSADTDTSKGMAIPPPPVQPKASASMTTVCINEVDTDTPGFDAAEFIELSGTPNGSLDHFVVVLFNGANDLAYRAYDLDGLSLDANGFFLIGNVDVAGVDLVIPNNTIQNGADAVAIYDTTSFVILSFTTTINLVDAIVYDTDDADDTGLLNGLGQSVQYNENENGLVETQSVSRSTDCGSTIVTQNPTPNASNGMSTCPSFSGAPDNVSITNSTCNPSCVAAGGLITAPSGNLCPNGSTLQYQVNSGSWSSTLPDYDQDGPAQTIKTRCSCDADNTMNSATSAPVTTSPANCTDNTLPTITCPTNIAVANTPGLCSAIVNYTTPVGTDNCLGAMTVQTLGLPSGASYPVGATTNIFKVTDASGNTATCAFAVSVTDTQLPTITCPANIAVANTPGLCSATISYTTPVGADNCSSPTTIQTLGLPSGSSFPVGATTNIFKVTDGTGNTATCAFAVSVTDTQLPTITCPANIAVASTPGLCSAIVSYTTPSGTDNCSGAATIQTAGLPSGSSFPVGATTNIFKVTDGTGNTATCAFAVSVTDTQLPTITCPGNIVSNCSASVTYITPVGTDNCSGAMTTQTSGLPSGSSFPAGVTTNTFKVTDASNNTSTCAFTVTISDTELPTISCPANIAVASTPGFCSAIVSYTTPVGTDNCSGAATVQTLGLPSGASFPVGATTNIFKVTDGAGNTATCAFAVSVTDTQLPTITCPANIAVASTPGLCSAIVSYTTPVGTDNCSGAATVQTLGLPSGASFPVGATTNIFKVTDGTGNTATCAFAVSVTDTQLPTITCPANIAVANTPGLCSAIVSYTTPVGTDNCSGAATVQTLGLPSGASFPVGATTNIFKVTDGTGNTATCAFAVSVTDTQLPTITCPANIAVASTPGLCSAIVSYTTPVGTDNCSGAATVQTLGLPSGASFPVGATTNIFKVTDGTGNTATCAFAVSVTDTQLPTITCPANIAVASAPGLCSAIVSYTTPVGTDNCSGAATVQTLGLPSGASFPVGATTNIFKVTDGTGNTATCAFAVSVTDTQLPTITCPANIAVASAPGLCSAIVSYTTPSGTDNCSGAATVQTLGLPSGASFPVGATTNIFKVTDGAGNTATCAFAVSVTDTQLPTITCPANIAVASTPGLCSATVSYTTPSGTDNCSGAATIQTAGLPSGASFPVGVTTNTFKVTDGATNSATCAFIVTVNDTQLPTISCPGNIAVNSAPGLCSAIVTYTTPIGTDNCSGATTVQTTGLASGASFPLGATVNTFRATDGSGNSATCAFTVTVADKQPPSITCPPNQNIQANGTCMGTVGAWAPASLSDNCTSTGSISVTQTPPATTVLTGHNAFSVVTLTANDGNGNIASCSFTVTLKDVTPPVAKCKNATVNLGANGTITVPTSAVDNGSTDNCAFTLLLTPGTFNCASIGINTVTLKATDAGGNTATCTAKITVRDLAGPTALCKNPVIFLDNTGHATLTISDIDNGSNDPCGIASRSISKSDFNCSELQGSTWPVILSLTDMNGNSSSCLAQVTVKDKIAPTAVCEDVTVQLGTNGKVTVSGAALAANSTDNCSIWSYSPIVKLYTTANLGLNLLTITVKDYSMNTSSCVSRVTVVQYDNIQDFHQQDTGNKGDFDFVVYPNPTSGETNVAFELPLEQEYLVRVFDMSGRLVYSHSELGMAGENVQAIRLSGMAAGMYLVDFQSEGLSSRKRLLLQE